MCSAVTYSENAETSGLAPSSEGKLCVSGEEICRSRIGKLSSCNVTESPAGSCVCNSKDGM